jgi:hypothetical protein
VLVYELLEALQMLSAARMPEPAVADLVKTCRQHMLQESTDELLGIELLAAKQAFDWSLRGCRTLIEVVSISIQATYVAAPGHLIAFATIARPWLFALCWHYTASWMQIRSLIEDTEI